VNIKTGGNKKGQSYMKNMIKIAIDSQYYRDQFDDWLAAGRV